MQTIAVGEGDIYKISTFYFDFFPCISLLHIVYIPFTKSLSIKF